MTEYKFIHEKLYPLLTQDMRNRIANYTSSRLDIEPCIEILSKNAVKLGEELKCLELAISRLKMIK